MVVSVPSTVVPVVATELRSPGTVTIATAIGVVTRLRQARALPKETSAICPLSRGKQLSPNLSRN